MSLGASLVAGLLTLAAPGNATLRVPDVLARHEELDGRIVEVRGWLGRCFNFTCALYADPGSAARDDFNAPHLTIGPRNDFDRRARPYRNREIVLRARFDNGCITGLCLDRASVLNPIRIMPVERGSRPSRTALSVIDVILGQQDLIGRRLVVRGVLSECERLSCGLLGEDRNGREQRLSIGSSASFDAAARRHSGRTVEIEARLTDRCLPLPDSDSIPVCADRSSTLADPVFIRAF